jgi:hypothetical protein
MIAGTQVAPTPNTAPGINRVPAQPNGQYPVQRPPMPQATTVPGVPSVTPKPQPTLGTQPTAGGGLVSAIPTSAIPKAPQGVTSTPGTVPAIPPTVSTQQPAAPTLAKGLPGTQPGVTGAGPAPAPPTGVSASAPLGNNPGMIAGAGNTDQGYTPAAPPFSGQAPPTNGGTLGTQPSPTAPALPTPSGTSGSAPGASTTPFTANQNLVGQQITPTTDPQTLAYQQMTQAAANNLNTNSPTALAQQEYNTFAQQSDPAYQQSLKQATDAAAAGGALGSGMLNTSLGNLANQRSLQLTGESQGLQENALQQQIANQFNTVGALSGLEGQSFGQGQTNLQDLMQQQGYQAGQQQTGIQNAAEEYQLEQAAQNQQFNQGLNETNAGYQGNPANYQMAIGQQYGTDAQQSYSNAGALLSNYAEQEALAQAQAGNPAATQGGLNLIGGQQGYIDPNTGLTTTDYGGGPSYQPPPQTLNPTYPGGVPVYDPTTGLPYGS